MNSNRCLKLTVWMLKKSKESSDPENVKYDLAQQKALELIKESVK